MRSLGIASAMFAMGGASPVFGWMIDNVDTAPEPVWMCLWGVALLAFSKTLHVRRRQGVKGTRTSLPARPRGLGISYPRAAQG